MSDDIKSLLQMLRYWETEPCLPGPAKTCKEARELIEQQAARIAELEARTAANGAEPVVWFGGNNYCTTNREIAERFNLRPAYAAPVASGLRYDWTVTGMRQSETGNWVMAGAAEKTGE